MAFLSRITSAIHYIGGRRMAEQRVHSPNPYRSYVDIEHCLVFDAVPGVDGTYASSNNFTLLSPHFCAGDRPTDGKPFCHVGTRIVVFDCVCDRSAISRANRADRCRRVSRLDCYNRI